jgi:hypothetical protein
MKGRKAGSASVLRLPSVSPARIAVSGRQAEEAIPVLEKAASLSDRSPGIICTLVWAYARAGRRSDALRLVEELKKREQTTYVPAAAMVNSYLGLGDKDQHSRGLSAPTRSIPIF